VQRGEEEIARAETDAKGNYELSGLAPGVYTLTFRKAGLKTAQHREVEVRAGKVRSLGDKVFLPVDEGAIAFVRGSVFDTDGRIVAGARVEIAVVTADGASRKVDGRVTNDAGAFSFRLTPDTARYRVTAKANGREATKDVEIEGAMVYRVALSLKPNAP
jgi:protocatechuate 3,4-dioxygenase beta subunit